MKSFARFIIKRILWHQANRLIALNKPTIIGVVGSIGKTSTKFAISQVLSQSRKVRWQEGNYNDITIVPLVFFGQDIPNLFNPLSWLRVILNNQRQIKKYPFDTVVLELGTDGPGQIAEFSKYLRLDIAIVTAVAPEHMEFFKTIDAVAQEELSVSKFTDKLIINTDLVDLKYLRDVKYISYGFNDRSDYKIKGNNYLTVEKNQQTWISSKLKTSKIQSYSLTSAMIVADLCGMSQTKIEQSISNVKSVPGRMQILKGIKGSIIIDDTYNASPQAMISALDELYGYKSKQKIALLGNMNELGDFSAKAHKEVGQYCDPKQLSLVITLGVEANKYLASSAEERGCRVKRFDNPYLIGEYLKSFIDDRSVILAKGSQNGVYMEEALKSILANSYDSKYLVRQSKQWIAKKKATFQ